VKLSKIKSYYHTNQNKIMTRNQSYRYSYWFGGLIVGALITFTTHLVFAWSEPTSAPPSGNVSGPITTGGNQTKNGSLTLTSVILQNWDGLRWLNGDYIYSDGSNMAMRTNGSLYMQDRSGNPGGDVLARDFYIGRINAWASNLATKDYVDQRLGWAGTFVRYYPSFRGQTCAVPNHYTGGCGCPSGYGEVYMITVEIGSNTQQMIGCLK
jgi:hypothetical protein